MFDPQALAAREEIKELRARYFRFVDGRDWSGFEALFLPDAILDLTDDTGRRLHGRQEIVSFVAAGLTNVVSIHHGHAPEICIVSPTRATGIWAMEDMLFWDPQSTSPIRKLHGYGHYHDIYAKIGCHWLFESVSLRRIRVDTV